MQDDNKDKEEKPESELLKIQREKYEAIIADKNKIIADLLKTPSKTNKKDEDEDDEDEDDEEEKAKKLEEERKNKRMAYYKKHIIL